MLEKTSKTTEDVLAKRERALGWTVPQKALPKLVALFAPPPLSARPAFSSSTSGPLLAHFHPLLNCRARGSARYTQGRRKPCQQAGPAIQDKVASGIEKGETTLPPYPHRQIHGGFWYIRW